MTTLTEEQKTVVRNLAGAIKTSLETYLNGENDAKVLCQILNGPLVDYNRDVEPLMRETK